MAFNKWPLSWAKAIIFANYNYKLNVKILKKAKN